MLQPGMRRLSFYLFYYCYICAPFRLILYFVSYIFNLQINVALQLTKSLLKKVTTTTTEPKVIEKYRTSIKNAVVHILSHKVNVPDLFRALQT